MEEQHGQGVPLRFIEYGQEIGAPDDHESAGVAHHSNKVDEGWHHAPEDYHQHSEVLVDFLKQPVKGQHEENQDDPAKQVANDAGTEEPLVSGDVVDRRGRVPGYEQFVGNIHKAQWADDAEEQVPESSDSPRVAG